MTVEEWKDRLEAVFGNNQSVEQQIAAHDHHERRSGAAIASRFLGYRMAVDRLLLFIAETLRLADTHVQTGIALPDGWYVPLLMDITTQFRRVRAAHHLFQLAHPLFGVALLRDVRERALLYAAVVRGDTTVKRIFGADAIPDWPRDIDDMDYAQIRKRRKSNQRAALRGTTKGLDAEVVRDLKAQQAIFDEQVHGALFLPATDYESWLAGSSPLPVLPEPSPNAAAQYVNRSTEVGWLFVRTLPILQLQPGVFGSGWADKWRLLDLSFAKMTGDQIPIGAAVQKLIESNLPFDPESTAYPKQE